MSHSWNPRCAFEAPNKATSLVGSPKSAEATCVFLVICSRRGVIISHPKTSFMVIVFNVDHDFVRFPEGEAQNLTLI